MNVEDPTSTIRVTGVVRSPEDGTTLPGVNVILKNSAQGTTTDGDGKFSLTLNQPGNTPVLVFSFIGFTTLEYPVSTNTAEQEILVEMLLDQQAINEKIIVGGCVVTRWYHPRTWWWKIRGIWR